MPLSNAERQRRYREKLKARAAGGDDLLERLNQAYEEGMAEGERETLERIDKQKVDDGELAELWKPWRDILGRVTFPCERTAEDWIKESRERGARAGNDIVLQARHDVLAELVKRDRAEQEKEAEAIFAELGKPARRFAQANGIGRLLKEYREDPKALKRMCR